MKTFVHLYISAITLLLLSGCYMPVFPSPHEHEKLKVTISTQTKGIWYPSCGFGIDTDRGDKKLNFGCSMREVHGTITVSHINRNDFSVEYEILFDHATAPLSKTFTMNYTDSHFLLLDKNLRIEFKVK